MFDVLEFKNLLFLNAIHKNCNIEIMLSHGVLDELSIKYLALISSVIQDHLHCIEVQLSTKYSNREVIPLAGNYYKAVVHDISSFNGSLHITIRSWDSTGLDEGLSYFSLHELKFVGE